MKEIRFTRNKNAIAQLINNAKEFIKILSFQFSDESFIREFILPQAKYVKIEIITLPEDSYKNNDDRGRIRNLFIDIENSGIDLHRCYWEVGDPTLSNSSQSGDAREGGGSKWYSLHGKLIFSEKQGIILTSNFTDQTELESYLLIDDTQELNQFKEKFLWLKSNFINVGEHRGAIFDKLDLRLKESVENEYKTSKRFLIPEYPEVMLQRHLSKQGLLITPFDGKARDYLYMIIDDSRKFLYLATERLFDEDLIYKLINHRKKYGTSIKIITGPSDQIRDNNAKAEKMIIDLLSAGIEVVYITDIHAKCWISDKVLAIGSVNLGQMNLGIQKTRGYWRSNTELLFLDNDLINEGVTEFINQFVLGLNPIKYMSSSSRSLRNAKAMFSNYSVHSRADAKELIGLISYNGIIQGQKYLDKIVELSASIKEYRGHRYVEKSDVVFALIRYQLSERKQDRNQLFVSLRLLISTLPELDELVIEMKELGLVISEDGFLKNNTDLSLKLD